jgi:drug/metabolite transporter (DMT)-like permease
VAGACLCWAIDNNLTRKVSGGDPVQVAAAKGLVAGTVNLALALTLGARLPAVAAVLASAAVGLVGYGVSLVLFVLALRHLGTARTGAYFSLAPSVGASVSLLVFQEVPGAAFLAAAALMGVGVWLHLTERHEHEHEPLEHDHLHAHDEHHQHEHLPTDPPGEPHSHPHRHARLRHSHPHYPDLHHRHEH